MLGKSNDEEMEARIRGKATEGNGLKILEYNVYVYCLRWETEEIDETRRENVQERKELLGPCRHQQSLLPMQARLSTG